MGRLLFGLRRDETGVSAIEFAMILPVLILLTLGSTEVARLIMLNLKLQNAAFIMADLAARDRTLNEAQVADIFFAVGDILAPFAMDESGLAVLSGIGAGAGGAVTVSWQRTGGGPIEATSRIGAAGGVATLPDSLDLAEGDTVVAAELFFDYQPLFGIVMSPQRLHKAAYLRPRLGTLTSILP